MEKTLDFLRQGINVLVVDLFPPSPRDPRGIHHLIRDHVREEPLELPTDKPLTLASYAAGEARVAYVEHVAVGDALPAVPLFVDPETYVRTPLDSAYEAAWELCPAEFREAVLESAGGSRS